MAENRDVSETEKMVSGTFLYRKEKNENSDAGLRKSAEMKN